MDPEDTSPQLAELFLRMTRRIRRAQADRLAPLGLTPAQERALRTIARSPEPLRMVDLAERLGVVPRSVTTLVDALERADLVRREPDPDSRRSTRLALTEAGRRTRAQMYEARRQAAEELFAPLSGEERVTLVRLLTVIDTATEPAADTMGAPESAAPAPL